MNLYEDGLSHLIGLKPRKKVLKKAVGWTLVIASVVTPITFRHAIADFGKRRATMTMKWVIDPALKRMNEAFAKQMREAQLRQQRQPEQQQWPSKK